MISARLHFQKSNDAVTDRKNDSMFCEHHNCNESYYFVDK